MERSYPIHNRKPPLHPNIYGISKSLNIPRKGKSINSEVWERQQICSWTSKLGQIISQRDN
jgi:hypothetical protein